MMQESQSLFDDETKLQDLMVAEADNTSNRSVELTTQSSKNDTSRSVRWSSSAQTTHIFESNAENPKATWYLKADLANFREQCKITRILARKGFKGSFSSIWGLEHTIDDELSRDRSIRKQESIDTVIEEQQGQREDGQYLPDFIAEIYQDISSLSQTEAHQQALRYTKELKEEDSIRVLPKLPKVDVESSGTDVPTEFARTYSAARKRKIYTPPMA